MGAMYTEPGWTHTTKAFEQTRRSTFLERSIRGTTMTRTRTTTMRTMRTMAIEDQDDPAKIFPGMKRKATSRTRGPKYVKRKTQAAPSTAAPGVIDDRRPDLTLIDVPVGESVLSHPYGRHGCLFMEVKVDANKKPNPQEVVSRLFFGIPITKACFWTGPEESRKETQRHPQKCCRSADSQVYPASDCGHRPAPPRYPPFHALLPPHHTVWYHI